MTTASTILQATLTYSQFCAYLGRSLASVGRDLASKRIPVGFRLGGRRYWLRSEVDAWLSAGCPDAREWELMKKHGRLPS